MAKIKLTKTELKSQQDSLKQYQRFLPTLQLKKQQLQLEIRLSAELLRENEERQRELDARLDSGIAVFGGEGMAERMIELVRLEAIECDSSNIAGVNVPVFKRAVFAPVEIDLYATDWLLDSAVQAVQDAVALREAHKILEEQYRLLSNELRTTTQRVNLFEKVKIPECKENIRTIRIQLSDRDTASVARSKIAKRKTQEAAAS